MKIPFLKKGNTIALAAPSRKVYSEDYEDFKVFLTDKGYKVKLATNIFESEGQFAGNDASRILAMNQLFEDTEIKAIIGIRGGYGAIRIVDSINWHTIKKHPKWICGYSDFTFFLNHQFEQNRLPSIHSDMPMHFGTKEFYENFNDLMNILSGELPKIEIVTNNLNKFGTAKGKLIGGNLSVLYSMINSRSFPNPKNKILFIEDLDEYLYHIDRMMMAMKRSNIFADLNGLVVGAMTDIHDNNTPFGKSAYEIISDCLSEYSFPILFDFPAGHTNINKPFFIGANTAIKIDDSFSYFEQKI